MARPVRISLLIVASAVLACGAAAGAPASSPRMPSEAQQDAAVARVAALGVPIYEAGPQGRYVALTFDDGPGPYTAKVLDELDRYGFRATWFVVGRNVARWGHALRREGREGTVGNHTWSHHYLPGLSTGQQIAEVSRTTSASVRITGEPVTLFRPPYGSTTTALNAWMKGRMLPVLWSADSRDSLGASREEILAIAKAGVKPGAIILLHENRGQTYWAVNRLLPWIRKQGYTAVTIPELLALNPPDLAAVRRRAGSGVGFR